MENSKEIKVDNGNQTSSSATVIFMWLLVGVPLVWGVYQTLIKSLALFQ